jgi:anaerobic magnesium-protoporphyrin IX monomethyl ester cyclase
MKVLLLNPPYSLEERYGKKMKRFGALSEPMGLAYLAGSLKEAGVSVEILDGAAQQVSPERIADIVRTGHFSLVGITFLTPMFTVVADLARRIKTLCPETHLVAGGPHPTALPAETLTEIPWIDSVCIGEGEKTIVDLASALSGGTSPATVAGIAYRKEGAVAVNPARPFEKNLDSLARPARELLPLDSYRLTASRTRGSGFCPTLIVARGCPFKCQFCSHPFGRTFRHHSIERIIEELRELKERYGSTQVNLEADTLTLDRKFLLGLCGAISRSGLNMSWTCESRVDTVDEEML